MVIECCTTILLTDGQSRKFTNDDQDSARKACVELAYLGERVLAYCDFLLPSQSYGERFKFNTSGPDKYNFPVKGYRFVGLISLTDPPRPFVYDAVHKCRTAGIKVIMVTGDHPITAIAIAKKCGIIGENHETRYEKAMLLDKAFSQRSICDEEAVVITGSELRNMDEEELDLVIKNYEEIVFARTSPQQKLMIVECCQRLGEIVAVTGDGVNDSPALRRANIGVAMGIAGSDVAKNAADMILLDDNFASIVTGIEEGRLIFDNLKKSIAYTLTSSVPEMMPMLVGLLFGVPLPIVMELVLCLDIGTDLLPAVALAYERAESDIMKRAPRNPQHDKLVNRRLISITYGQIGMTQALAGFYTYFTIFMFHGFFPGNLINSGSAWEDKGNNDFKSAFNETWDYQSRKDLLNTARSGYFVSVVVTQMIDLLMCKTRRNSIFEQGLDNWTLNFSLVIETILLCFLLYMPGVDKLISVMPLHYIWFLPCLPFGLMLWMYDEGRRYWIRHHPGSFIEKETYY